MANPENKVNLIVREIIQKIESGEWGKSGMIPPRATLAKQYGTTTSTMNDVFSILHSQGYVVTREKHVWVNPNRMSFPALVPSFDEYLLSKGIKPYIENIGEPKIIQLGDDLCQSFTFPIGTKAIKRYRIQGEDRSDYKIPYRITQTFYPVDLAEQYLQAMKKNSEFVVIKAIKADTGLSIDHYHIEISSRIPTEEEMKLLFITLQTGVVEMFRKCYSREGQLIMFNHIVAPAYRFKILVDATVSL